MKKQSQGSQDTATRLPRSQCQWLHSTRPLRRWWLGFWLLPMMYEVCCQGGSIQWRLSQGTGKIRWCKSFRDFFFLILSIPKKEPSHPKKHEQASLHEKNLSEIFKIDRFSNCLLSQQAQKTMPWEKYGAERRLGFCFCKITPCDLLWAVWAAIGEAATGLLWELLLQFLKIKSGLWRISAAAT